MDNRADRADRIDPLDSGELAVFVESLGGEAVALSDPDRTPELDPAAVIAGGPGYGKAGR